MSTSPHHEQFGRKEPASTVGFTASKPAPSTGPLIGEAERDLAAAFLRSHPAAAAGVLERVPVREAAVHLEGESPELVARIVSHLVTPSATAILEEFSNGFAAAVVTEFDLEQAAALLRRLGEGAREGILAEVPADRAEELRKIVAYPPETAGALMDPRMPGLPEDMTAGEALARIRRDPQMVRHYLYVIDRGGRLCGSVSLRQLTLARSGEILREAMGPADMYLRVDAGKSEIVGHPGWHQLHALPVVGGSGELLGVMRYRTMRTLEAEAKTASHDAEPMEVVRELGELYAAGMVRFVEAAAEVSRDFFSPGRIRA